MSKMPEEGTISNSIINLCLLSERVDRVSATYLLPESSPGAWPRAMEKATVLPQDTMGFAVEQKLQ